MKQIRFALISPQDLVNKVQRINRLMLNDKYMRKLVLNALNHHLVPNTLTTTKCRKIFKNLSSSSPLIENSELVEDEAQLNIDMRATVSSMDLLNIFFQEFFQSSKR